MISVTGLKKIFSLLAVKMEWICSGGEMKITRIFCWKSSS